MNSIPRRFTLWLPLFILLSLAFGLLTSCAKERLVIFSQYVGRNNLASYYVNTPDPLLNNPPVGQRILMEWSLPRTYLDYPDLHLELTVRFRNRQETRRTIPIHHEDGEAVYALMNATFYETGGIVTYKVDVVGGGQLLEKWRHQLWVELITLNVDQPQEKAKPL